MRYTPVLRIGCIGLRISLRIALRIEPEVKLLPCVAKEKDSVRNVLLELLYTILEEMEG